jgi:acyl-coenzyme A thioesterase PaaI-like protein
MSLSQKEKKNRGVNYNGKELLKILVRESVHSSFGKFLGSTIQSIQFEDVPEKLTFRYLVPPALCHEFEKADGSKELIFSTSGVLSVLDEFSTYALILEDKTYRPGVSVDLFVESLKPAYGNEEVLIVTRSDKIGKILAFCTIEMTTLDGEILARGKHVKYLPMGFFYELITGTFLLGIALFVYRLFRGNKFSTPLDATVFQSTNAKKNDTDDIDAVNKGKKGYSSTIDPEIFQNEHVFNILQVKSNENPLDRKVLLAEAPDNHHCDVCELFDLKVTKNLKNGVGILHGGALALAIEDASRQFKESHQPELEHLLRVRSLDIRYISAMKVSTFHS